MFPKKGFTDEQIVLLCGGFRFNHWKDGYQFSSLKGAEAAPEIRRVSCALADNDRPMRYRASTFDCSPCSHERVAVLPDRRTPERFTPMLA